MPGNKQKRVREKYGLLEAGMIRRAAALALATVATPYIGAALLWLDEARFRHLNLAGLISFFAGTLSIGTGGLVLMGVPLLLLYGIMTLVLSRIGYLSLRNLCIMGIIIGIIVAKAFFSGPFVGISAGTLGLCGAICGLLYGSMLGLHKRSISDPESHIQATSEP